VICGQCIHRNNRFADYCPYCQVSNVPSLLPQGLKDPPSYTSVPLANTRTVEVAGPPPPYVTDAAKDNSPNSASVDQNKKPAAAQKTGDVDDEKAAWVEDTLHFVDHQHDSIPSLSLRYNVPATALRRANNITSDHLLLARRTVIIPGEFYKAGISLSPRPIEGEEEEQRKAKIRRFMTSCKVSDYDVALLYLEQSGYDLEAAAVAFYDDEAWERAHPNQKRKSSSAKDTGKKPSIWSGTFQRFRK